MRMIRNPVGQYFLYGARRDKGTRAMLTFYGWRYLRPFDGLPAAWGTSEPTIATHMATALGLAIESHHWDGSPA